MTQESEKLWGGRFREPTAPLVESYTNSIAIDRRIALEDVRGSMAHARMLGHQGIIPAADVEEILSGLLQLREEIESGKFQLDAQLEDIHMNVESRLAEIAGAAAGRLHTARSRNDQVVTDLRMWLKVAIAESIASITDLQTSLVETAAANRQVILPGYTHLQRAQPVMLSHHLLAYFEMLERDLGRFADCYQRVDVLPLGSGALAGVPYPIDREMVAKELDFATISANSIDAVSDRDFVIEYLSTASITMMHLSRMSEDIILWSTAEFGFVDLPDAFSTGSSIMPQKKNPDVLELARGRTGKVYGALMTLLTTMKGLPLAYNRDLQEDKEPLFMAHDTMNTTLAVISQMLPRLRFRGERSRRVSGGMLLATDLADYLTGKGLPFREAHHVVGRLVAYCEANRKEIRHLTIEEFRMHSELFDEDAMAIDTWVSVRAKDVPGGTAPRRVTQAIRRARTILKHREQEG